jgi:sec-independent protein translocase protein TatC
MADDASTSDQRVEGEMTLMEHLTELRQRIVKSAIAVVVGAVGCLVFYDRLFDVLIDPYCKALEELDSETALLDECVLVLREPLEGFSLVLTVAGYGGLMIAMPVILWQLWQFVVPGLYPHEKRWAIPFVFSGAVLFFFGSGLAYWSIPRALDFLLNIAGPDIAPFLGPGPYLSFLIKMLVAFGLGFQFPLILILLQLIGVITVAQLRSGRRYAIVGIVILVAVLTPSGDPITLMVLSVPMYIFYEAAIIWGWLRSRRKKKTVRVK